MKFAEFHEGQQITLGPVSVTREAVIDFATQWDPQWFHTDEERAKQHHFGGLIASGWHTCCIAMRLVADNVLKGSESFASPGMDQLRWLKPVHVGDALTVHLFVREVRRSASRPELGILRWDWRVDNQHQAPVLQADVTSMFQLSLP